MKRFALLSLTLLACSGSDESTPGTTIDSATEDTAIVDDVSPSKETIDPMLDSTAADTTVAETAADSSAVDTTVADSTAADSPGDASGCHAVTFGAAAASITKVTSLPAMTGGTIAAGIYDATEVKTTGTVTGTYRATWSFGAAKIDAIEQLTISASPPPPSVRTFSFSTAGASFSRTLTCGGSMMFTNTFSVRSEAAGVFLDVRQDTLMFTFKKR